MNINRPTNNEKEDGAQAVVFAYFNSSAAL